MVPRAFTKKRDTGSTRVSLAAYVAVILAVVALILAVVLSGCGKTTAAAAPAGSVQASSATAGSPVTATASGSGAPAVPVAQTQTPSAASVLSGGSPAEIVAAKAGPSVVNVRVTGVASSAFFGSEPYEGVGSGVIYSSDGYIITCDHVVTENGSPAETVEVTLSTGEKLPAKIVATDPFTDIAVIKVAKTGLPAATFTHAANVRVGEYAIAIGSPEDYSNSVTMGIVSGLGRSIDNAGSTALFDLIQTDAAISPGNSGGALLDEQSQVIGINEAYLPPAETGAENIAFAIPADTAVNIAKELISTGHASHPYPGITYTALTPQLQARYRLSQSAGLLVTDVDGSGPAAKAGVQPGDIIVTVNGKTVTQEADLILVLTKAKIGQTLALGLDRNGSQLTLNVILSDTPASTS
jgi:S1-C subfamily serine protease